MSEFLSKQEKYTIAILFLVNVLNYMDRYIVAGILGQLREEFQIGDDYLGLLQTAFTLSYTVCAPVFGYLGDRYSRKKIITTSLAFWATATFVSSFVRSYASFMVFRILVGIGESSFTSIGPTIIYDVTYKNIRKYALALFYTAIPVGSALGLVVGSAAARIGGDWSWTFRVTPILGVIGTVLLCFIKDSVRGERECLEARQSVIIRNRKTFLQACASLCKNRSYVYSTLAFTTMAFANGALSWWGPIYMYYGFILIPVSKEKLYEEIAIKFGSISLVAGVLAVSIGAHISRKFSKLYPPADPIICALALFCSIPVITIAILVANKSVTLTYANVFLCEIAIGISWPIIADILLSVVLPECRSTAESIQIAFSHALGDAGSPFLVGVLSEKLKSQWIEDYLSLSDVDPIVYHQFAALKYALLSTTVVLICGALLFIACSFHIVADRDLVLHTLVNSQSGEEIAVGETVLYT